MNNHGSDGVPDLGKLGQKRVYQAQLSALPRTIDHRGWAAEDELNRHDYLDGTQLLEEIREIVKSELRAFARRIGRGDLADSFGVEEPSDLSGAPAQE
jgi:hypothetical protein